MEKNIIEEVSQFVSPEERMQLVRRCAVLTGDREVAEDLAQETLLEAWRHQHTLRDQTRRTSWLSGVARYVCLRWLRERRRDTVHLITPLSRQHPHDAQLADLEDSLADDLDLEGLVLSLPEGRQFLHTFPRIRTLPKQQVEADGRSALVTRFESVTNNATLTVVSAYDTYEVLRICRGGW